MQAHYFLFAIAFLFTLFATIQDIKKREVANWLNFSFIAFALAYRAFCAIHFKNIHFFLLGLSGFAIFFILAHAFYYSRAFAGGDAKLLMGFGIILPYQNYSDLIYLSLIFIFALFLIGAVYSLIYSIFIAIKQKTKFKKEFRKRFRKSQLLQITAQIIFIILLLFGSFNPLFFLFSVFFLFPILYLYTKSLDICMVSLCPSSKLTEGDWLEKNVKLSPRITIEKSVHGLSQKDIELIKKYKKSVLIKEGIPFVPAFMITLIILSYLFLTGFSFYGLF
ncbi:MAG: A24 family peptidase [archaeon]